VSRFAVVAAAALALVALPSGSAAGPVDRLTLEQQVGQLLVLSFRGTMPPEYVRRAFRERRAAGVILFAANIRSPEQVRELTLSLRRAGGNPLVAIDQEGGSVRRVSWAPPFASQREQLEAGSVRVNATAAAQALRGLGITVSFAPVADVPKRAKAALAGRAFSGDPAEVSRAVRAAVAGWEAGGVAAAVKHFPGLGAAPANTDDDVVTIRSSRAELDAFELPPFEAAVAAGVPLVMLGHARYPALDRRRIASQSPAVVRLLRERLDFRGVVVTDSMEAQASLATGSIEQVSERAILAGADLVLLTGRGSYRPVHRHLVEVARRSPAFRERVRESAARVLALRSQD
jgi:beta-N-acetylhexosaminidase